MKETKQQRAARQAKTADFISAHIDRLEGPADSQNLDLDHVIDILRNARVSASVQNQTLDVAHAFLSRHGGRSYKDTIKAEDAAPAAKRTMKNSRGKAQLDETTHNVGNVLRQGKDFTFDLLKFGTSLTTHTLGIAGATATFGAKAIWRPWSMMANGWGSLMSAAGIGKTGRNFIGVAGIAASAAFVMMPIDASANASILGHVLTQADLHQACINPAVWNADKVSAAFAIAHGDHSPDIDMVARASLKAGLAHGIAPESPFYIAYYETNGFRDLVANNSSATSAWQMIDSTKFSYIKQYGRDTVAYQQATQRLLDGTSQDPDRDRTIRDAVDAVVAASQDTLDTALAQQKLPPLLFTALNLANDTYFAAELIALDIYKNAPALRLENLAGVDAATRAELTGSYYAPDHFLGATNARYASQLMAYNANVQLNDAARVAELIGNSGARKLSAVVNSNPGLLNDDITAGQLLPRITAYFGERVATMVEPVKVTAQAGTSTFDLCVVNKEKLTSGPILASRAEIAYAIVAPILPTDQLNAVFGLARDGLGELATLVTAASERPETPRNDAIGQLILNP